MKVYAGQTNVTITLDTDIDLSSASTTLIKWKKTGSEGSFTATVSGTKLVYEIETNDLTVGEMTIWAYVIFSDDKIGIGEPVKIKVYKESE